MGYFTQVTFLVGGVISTGYYKGRIMLSLSWGVVTSKTPVAHYARRRAGASCACIARVCVETLKIISKC